MKKIYILILALVAASGCVAYLPEEILLPLEDISLTIKGEEIMKFDEGSCQLGYNNRKNEFRVLDDRLANWFILRCDALPSSVGQVLTCELEYTTPDDVKSIEDLEFSVEKTDENGLIWLWEGTRKIGVVIKTL